MARKRRARHLGVRGHLMPEGHFMLAKVMVRQEGHGTAPGSNGASNGTQRGRTNGPTDQLSVCLTDRSYESRFALSVLPDTEKER